MITTILCLMPFCLIGWLVWKDRDKQEGVEAYCEYQDDLDN